MKNEFDVLHAGAGAASMTGSAKAFEMHAGGAAPKGGCGSGGSCGCAGKRPNGAGASVQPMAAHMRTVLEETGRVLQKMPGADPTGGLNRMFQALQAMTDDLLRQMDNPPRR